MHLTTAHYQQFAQALERSFPNYVSLQQIVKRSMDQDLNAIVTTRNFSDTIFGVIRWADSHDRIDDLLNAAREVAPTNPDLQILAAALAPLVQPLSRDQRNQLYRWRMRELLQYQVPLAPWVAPKRRGRPPKPAAAAAA